MPGPPKPAEHDRTLPDRARERSREKDAADKPRSASSRTERDVRPEHGRDERSRDTTRAGSDRQPLKTSAAAATSDSRAKSSSSSAAGAQPTSSSQPRSSSSNIPARSDTTADRSAASVCDF